MKKIVLSLVIGSFVLAGCKHTSNDEPEFERQVTIQCTVNSTFSSYLKSTHPEDVVIDEVILYGVDNTGAVITIFDAVDVAEITSSTGTTIRMSSKITTIYAVANPTVDMDSDPKTVDDLTSMTCNYTGMPVTSFVMSGSKAVSSNIVIDLERAIAKIEVKGEDLSGFVVTAVTVKNTPTKGYVFPQTPLDVSSFSKTSYVVTPYSPLYVAENTIASPTTLTVTGTYETETYNVNVDFKVSGALVPIERNKCYLVTIVPNPDPGQEYNVKVQIIPWIEVDIDPQEFDIDF